MNPITPAEASAAHPKCGTCEHREWDKYSERDSCAVNAIWVELTDYCNNHSELTKEKNDE